MKKKQKSFDPFKKLSKKERKKRDKKRKREDAIRIEKYVNFLKTNNEWDGEYIIDLLRFKIKRSRKYITKHNMAVPEHLQKVVSKMKETEKLLKNVFENEYSRQLDKEFKKKFGGNVRYKTKFHKNRRFTIDSDYSSIKPELLEQAIEERNKQSKKASELQKADLKKAFEIINDNIWDWWD